MSGRYDILLQAQRPPTPAHPEQGRVRVNTAARPSLPPDSAESTPEQIPAQDERTIDLSNVQTNERTAIRQQVRHSFDIFADQVLSLRSIALAREGTFGKRVLLGDLVQQALDRFITKERNTERSNV